MPVVIIGGVAIELIDALFILMLAVVLVAVFTGSYRIAQNMQDSAGNVPLIGGPLANLFANGISFMRGLAYSTEGFFEGAFYSFTRGLGGFLYWALKYAWDSVSYIANSALYYGSDAYNYVHNTILPTLQQFNAQITRIAIETDQLALVTVPKLAVLLLETVTHLNVLQAQTDVATKVTIPALQAALNDERAARRALEGRLAAILPIVGDLALYPGFRDATNQRLKGLEGTVADEAEHIKINSADIAKVLPLSVVAALGAAAIATLVRTATDPCNVCLGINLSDVEGRIAALEYDSG